jgi:hypothetical protein
MTYYWTSFNFHGPVCYYKLFLLLLRLSCIECETLDFI